MKEWLKIFAKMKRHFPKLRQLLKVFAVMGPVMMFGAFVCFADRLIGSTMLCWLAGLGLAVTLSIRLITNSIDPAPSDGSDGKMIVVAAFLIELWLVGVPEFHAFLDKLAERNLLMDIRPICACLILTLCAISKSSKAIDDLSDEDIYRCLNGKSDPRISDA